MIKKTISKDVEVMAICTKCLISAMGMQAENQYRAITNSSPAYTREHFDELESMIEAAMEPEQEEEN